MINGIGACAIFSRTCGHLNVRSGRITLGDPILVHALEPCALAVPAGTHAVDVVQFERPGSPGSRQNMLVRVRLNDNTTVTWKYASTDKSVMDTVDVHTEDLRGFGVDAGTAVLFDPEAQQRLMSLPFDPLWTDLITVNKDFVAFSTNGDGFYPAYWGFDPSGAPCQLIIDLLTIECSCVERSGSSMRDSGSSQE